MWVWSYVDNLLTIHKLKITDITTYFFNDQCNLRRATQICAKLQTSRSYIPNKFIRLEKNTFPSTTLSVLCSASSWQQQSQPCQEQNGLRYAFYRGVNNGANTSKLNNATLNKIMLRDSFKLYPPINFASERESPTNAHAIRSAAKTTLSTPIHR